MSPAVLVFHNSYMYICSLAPPFICNLRHCLDYMKDLMVMFVDTVVNTGISESLVVSLKA